MPTLPLPTGGAAVGGGTVPVSDEADVLPEFAAPIRKVAVAPVRDAFVAGWTEGFKKYQDIAARAAAQCDPARATGDYLRDFAEERGIIPGVTESEASIRARLFATPDIVTPEAIRAEVDKLLAPYTAKASMLTELELDGVFVHDDNPCTWDSFIGTDPDYPDRYYPELPWLQAHGWVPSSGYSGSFLIRVPPLEDNDTTVSYAFDFDDDGIFAGNGADVAGSESDGSVAFSLFVDPRTADELYSTIISVVEAIKGQGINWSLVVDPSL